MKINRIEYLIQAGEVFHSEIFTKMLEEVTQSINAVRWPAGGPDFALYPGTNRQKTHNGVTPIKIDCMKYLEASGWELEHNFGVGVGPIDAAKRLDREGIFVVEWETGNISSTHRALNKMALGLIRQKIIGGFLILPSRLFYTYLTDRIGNFREIEPYFDLYRRIQINEGVLGVIEVEYDRLDNTVPRIPLGTDGRAKG